MALSDKTIVITPRTSVGSPLNADPNIRFTAAGGSPDVPLTINLFARPINSGTLSFEGSAGQLFSITNDLTGTIFSVNDVSGVPSIEVDANGVVRIGEFGDTVQVGLSTGSPIDYGSRLQVQDDFSIGLKGSADADGRAVLIEGAANASTGEAAGRIFFTENNNAGGSANNDLYGLSLYYEGDGNLALPSGHQPNTGNATWSLRRHDNSLNGTAVMSGTRTSNNVTFSGQVTATGNFVGDLTGNASTATSATSATTATTATTATNVAASGVNAGNLGSGVLPYSTVSATSSAFKVPFINTTAGVSGNFGLLFDADGFTYNPSTNALAAGTLTLGAATSSTLNISSTTTGNIVIDLPGTSNIKKITDQGGTSFYCDSTMLLHAGDSGPALETDLGITSATTTETLWLTADGDVSIISNRQTNYATAYQFDFTNAGVFRIRNAGGPGTDYAEFSHDGTDFNIAATNTTDLNITGTNVTIDASSVLRFENAVTERIVMYGTENSATSYAMGVESSTLYYKANGNHRWYISANADLGVSDTMNLSSTALHVGVPIYPNGQTVGNITSVGGNYGSINVTGADGSSGTYAGYSINDRVVFMNNGSTTSGIYDDTNNEWHILMTQNGAVNLYNNGVVTGATGIESFDVFANDSLSTSTCFYSWKLADGTRRGFIGYSGSDSIVWRSEVHGATVNINAEDAGGTLRTILAADPDSTTELRADTNLSLTVSAGQNALVATGGGAVSLYWNNDEAFRTQDYNGSDNITAAEVSHWDNTFYDVGLAVMPQVTATGALTVSDTHQHKTILITSGTGAISFVSDTTMKVNSVGWIINNSGSANAITATTNVFWADGAGGQTGSRTLADGGWLTWWKQADAQYYITGVGIS